MVALMASKMKCRNILKQRTPKYYLKNRKCGLFSKIMTFMAKITKYDFIEKMRQNMTFYDLITF